MKKIPDRVMDFLHAFTGDNFVEAMQMAGYKGQPSYLKSKANAFLREPIVQETLRKNELITAKRQGLVAEKQERREFLSKVVRNQDIDEVGEERLGVESNIPLAQRVKAVELSCWRKWTATWRTNRLTSMLKSPW